ncbi:hypothetical protein A0O34_20575 [Chryseobacterium glaciei]|uniref:DUF6705 domain-containing protein n=1 Tax=Chryseobacterium glaciei TaxID=1685010 RepID=A0A172Y0N2_9FLAO|nr:DUF6705 family protein [Chryseobacterium glaciei]ANF52761.1 hypothetical protein A0O34_20575 [Chryseobacterium glaciei]
MKSLIIFLGVFVVFSCKAQQTYPLNTYPDDVPAGSYLKDLNNELTPYIGSWNASFNGTQIFLFISKQPHKLIQYGERKFYRDVLSIKYQIKNSLGVILQDTQNMSFQSNQIEHTIYSLRIRPTLNVISFNYGGTNCGVGWGSIRLKKLNSTQISWEYIPNSTIIDSNKCPSGTDINIYLPETKDLIFTKQ